LTGNHATQINTSSNPWFQGSVLSVTAGSVTLISKASEVAAQNIAPSISNQVLGGYATNFSGEPVSVQSQTFRISTSTGSTAGLITSVTLVNSNGAVVAGPVDAVSSDGGTTQTVTFTDTVTYPIGRAVYTLKGKLPSNALNGTTLVVDTTPSSWSNVTGQTTGNNVSITTGNFSMNTMTVKGANMAVNISAQPASQAVVKGVQNFVLANFQLDATQSGEDVRLSSFPVIVTAGTVADLTGCALWNGTTQLNTGSRTVNTLSASGSKTVFSFDNSMIVSKGTSMTLSLQCNVSSSATSASYQVTQDSTTGDYSLTGVTSGVTVIPTFGSGNGGTMTVASGSFAVNLDASTPNYVTVADGTTGVDLGHFKFRATNEDVNLTKVGLVLTAGSASDIANGLAYIYNGTQLLGQVQFPQGAGAVATSTLTTMLPLKANTDYILTIKGDMAAIGVGQSGTEGKLVKIDVVNAEGSGVSSGLTLKIGNVTAGTSGVRTFAAYPTVAQDTLAGTGVSDGKLMRFKVTASGGNVGLYQLKFTLATSSFVTGGGVSSLKLNVFTDSGYSQVAGGQYGAASGQFGATNGTTGGTTLPINPTVVFQASTNPLQIPSGVTYYFELDSQVAGTQVGTSVTTTLLGDAAFSGINNTANVASSTNNMIWSGNATTTAVFNDSDWVNGYGILNLPAGGFTQTRSN
jgi:hypothetical protein